MAQIAITPQKLLHYPPRQEILTQLTEIIQKTEHNLEARTLYNNIFNSTGDTATLVDIFDVPIDIIQEIKSIKALKSDMTVPSTIKQQLLSLDTNAVMCWGSSNFIGTGPIDPHHNGRLIFSIQNLRDFKKGFIQIDLNYKDLYNIKIYDIKKESPLYEIEDIFVDELIEAIGDKIGF